MIAFVRGKLVSKTPDQVVIDVGGVGYEILVPLSTYNQLPQAGEELQLHTCSYMRLRQDEIRLYGFLTQDERRLFQTLMPVTGVGPAMICNILSRLTPIQFRLAISQNDTATLAQVKGISQQRARELIVKLKKRMDDLEFSEQIAETTETPTLAQVVGGLVGLGVSQAAAEQAAAEAQKVLGDEAEFDDLLALALRYAARPTGG